MRMFIFTKSNNLEGTIELGLGKPQKLKSSIIYIDPPKTNTFLTHFGSWSCLAPLNI